MIMKANGRDSRTDDIEKNVIEKISGGINFVDNNVKINKPDINHFRQLVFIVEEKKVQKLKKETFIFSLFALVILSAEMFAFSNSFLSFIVVQVLAITLLPFSAFLVFKLRKLRKVDII